MEQLKKLYSLCMHGNYKQWCVIYVAIFLFPILAVFPFNVLVDSSAYFSVNLIDRNGLEQLLNGKTISEVHPKNARSRNRYLIKNREEKVDIIAVGSSRTHGLRREYITSEETFFNHAMSRAGLEDYIGIVGGYKKFKGYIPRKVILGVDPWVFNGNNQAFLGDWEIFNELYFYLIGEMGAEEENLHKEWNGASTFQRLLSVEYFIANIVYLYNILIRGEEHNYVVEGTHINIPASPRTKCDLRKAYPTYAMESIECADIPVSPCPTCEMRKVYFSHTTEPDGSKHYPINYLFRGNAGEKTFEAEHSRNGFENYKNLSNTRLFEKFVDYLQEENVEVIFFLSPFHNFAYKRFLLPGFHFNIIMDVEVYLRKIAMKKNIQLIGSYNPNAYSLTSRDFMDSIHATSYAIGKIFKVHQNDLPH